MDNGKKFKKIMLLAVKIAVGSSTAICIAQELHLEYAISAGTITLLTLLATKWETVKLSVFRLVTFAVSVLTAWIVFAHIDSLWFAYGIFIFIVVLLSETMGWRATISVNSVIGAHLLTSHDFSADSIRNEFFLVIIGVSIAFLLNLFHDNHNRENAMIADMRQTEKQLQMIMRGLADELYREISEEKSLKEALDGQNRTEKALDDRNGLEEAMDGRNNINRLEESLRGFLKDAYEFQDNTFYSHPGYYIDYFEMRQGQCRILHELYEEIKKIRSMPKQAGDIADYMRYLADYVVEKNEPSRQMDALAELFKRMEKEELPKTRPEFEARAVLYHVLMQLDEFLDYKFRFVKGLDDRQRKKYWNSGA